MFSEYRIPAALLYLLCSVLYVAGEEEIRLQELEGNTVTIQTGITGVQTDAHILWLYISENVDVKIVNSQIICGEIITDYNRDRFRDRLQLNRNSGSLTIRDISREDSGVYELLIITGHQSVWSYSVDVYAPVSKPIIRNQAGNHSVIVENGSQVQPDFSTKLAVLIPVGLIVAGLSTLLVRFWKKKRKKPDAEKNYIEVKTSP